jgi:hypothetical protein
MQKTVMIVLITLAFALPKGVVAANNPAASGSKPSSLVPHPTARNHVYGSPISTAIVGHRKASHQKHTPAPR